MEGQQQQNNSGCGCCMPIIVIVVVFIIAIMAVAMEAYDRLMESDPTTVQSAETKPAENAVPAIKQDGHVFNLLLIGHDFREGESGQRSDSMILCTVNVLEKKMTMTSFLRDLYVSIPGHGKDRLNAAYSFGGAELLDETLRQNFGVKVDYNVEISFEQFEAVLELFGGVSMELTQKEAEHLGGGLVEGVNQLTPRQALDYARIRKLDSDFGRTERQRKVISALLKEMKKMEAEELSVLLNRLPELVTTDMPKSEIGFYAFMVMLVYPKMEFETQHIPADGAYTNEKIDGKAVLVPDLEKNIAILKDTIGS